MANIDTIKSLTDNVQTVLQNALGFKFERKNLEDVKDMPASKYPLGVFFDSGIEFEYTHGQKAGYGVQSYLVWIIFKERNDKVRMRKNQERLQQSRTALTVNALNVGDLSASKLVSWVEVTDIDTEHQNDGLSVLNYTVAVRYREL